MTIYFNFFGSLINLKAAGVMVEIEKAKSKATKKDLNQDELENMRQKYVSMYEK